MKQISIPLVFLEYKYLILESDFLQTRIILEKSQSQTSLTYLDNWTGENLLVTKSNYVPANINMIERMMTLNEPYLISIIFIFHHIHSHMSLF